ncbi:hypothetical protein AGMMS49992_14660 [Clostridia bacterium]|nr:hypothetical protein AGMMS49992_14660 [Clostridia bacterium]
MIDQPKPVSQRHIHTTALLLAVIILLTSALYASSAALAEDKVAVAVENVIIRTKPSKESDGQKSVKAGQKMEILDGGTSGWLHVKYGVIIGYVSKDYVKVTTASAVTAAAENLPGKISDLGAAPSPTKEGSRGTDVTKLQKALKIAGYYRDSCDGIFGDKTIAAVKAFQKAKGMTVDGIAGPGTIRILFDVPASAVAASATISTKKYVTLKLDWYKGGSTAIPKGANFTIKDVRSGRTFQAHHLYGTNHMDAEPLTAADSATMKACYGGAWSWDRRPILIQYGGRVYAASMNGMPHGDSSISNNNFNGQFCIHFLNSRTHETNKVDNDHQACVNEAAKAAW